MGIICVFGASGTWGAWDTELGGWVNRLRLWVDKKSVNSDDFYYETYNLGISGDNSAGLSARIDSECACREPDIIIVSIGGNDSAIPPHDVSVPINDFSTNIKEIIDNAKQFTSKVLFLNLAFVNESLTMPVEWDDDLNYSNSRIKGYNIALANICGKEKISLLDISSMINEKDLFDGLHLNSAGHEKIFLKVKDFLVKKKWLEE